MIAASMETPMGVALDRMANDWRPGDVDGRILLVVGHGGAIATTGCIGAALGLKEMGVLDVSDGIGGASAASTIGPAEVCDKLDEMPRVFRSIVTEGFGNPVRAARDRAPLADLQLVHNHIGTEAGLDTRAIKASKRVVAFNLTDMTDLSGHMQTNRDVPEGEMVDRLIDGMRMPWLTGPRPGKWADGDISLHSPEQLAAQAAVLIAEEQGYDRPVPVHVLSLANNAYSEWTMGPMDWVKTAAVAAWAAKHTPKGFGHIMKGANRRCGYKNELDATGCVPYDPAWAGRIEQPRVQKIHPQAGPNMPGLLGSVAQIDTAIAAGRNAAIQAVENPDSIPTTLCARTKPRPVRGAMVGFARGYARHIISGPPRRSRTISARSNFY